MPQTVFVKETDAEGKDTYREVQVPTADELADVQKKLAEANADAAKKRHALNALKDKAKTLGADDSEETPEQADKPQTAPQSPAAVPVPLNEDDIVAKAVLKMQEQQDAATKRDAELKALIAKHNLPDNMMAVLKQSLDPVAAAEEMGRTVLTFAGQATGKSQKSNSVSDAAKAAFTTLGLDYPED